jgi:ABC-2 type transport system permease protein
MISALCYLQYHSVVNRLKFRFKRLKQPKYLVGAIVGGIYFYWYFSRVLFASHGRPGVSAATAVRLPADPLLWESLRALILFVVVLLAWVIPRKRAALAFTEAEVAFLFPAPVTRRTLIRFKLLRSQIGILFTALLFTLISNRWTLIHMAGWWVVLSTLNLHFLGSSFALTMLLDRGIANWQRRLGVLAVALLAFGAVAAWAAHAMPPLTRADLANLNTISDYARQVLVSGPLPYLLYPFCLVVRPYLAPGALEFLFALWPALLLLAAHYWWVMRSDVAFEEASVEASQKLAVKIAAMRAGNWRTAGRKLKSKRAPFKLAPAGPQPTALLWKNLIAAGQAFTLRTWIVVVAVVFGTCIGLRGTGTGSNWLPVVGSVAAMFGVWIVLLGPQIVRQDFRQDLPLADVLKTYPMRGWQVALGEILAPAVILTAVQWLLLIIAVALFSQVGSRYISGPLVVVIGLGTAMVLPMLNLISLLIPNAAVLLFPAWFQAGKDAPHGIEATGQRLIFFIGQFLAFAIALIPAAGVFVGFFFLVKFAAGVFTAVPVASVAAALVLAVEAGLGVMLLGWLFERFDVSAEPAT